MDDFSMPIGMSVGFVREDLESASQVIVALGFEGIEVFLPHLGPGLNGVTLMPAHAAAARELLEQRGLRTTVLNCIVGNFEPLRGGTSLLAASHRLSAELVLASELGADRVLIWDCETDDTTEIGSAASCLAECVDRAYSMSGLSNPPVVSVELHPNTVGWKHGVSAEIASRLTEVGGGICLDFCHAGVVLGPRFIEHIAPEVLAAVNLVHWSDSDCVTEQLHFPPGRGCVDLIAAVDALAGRGLQMSWDLFSWPSPRAALLAGMADYRGALRRLSSAAR